VRCAAFALFAAVFGSSLAIAEPVPLDIRAERLDFDRKAGLARFEGDVVARQGDFELRCARLVATYASGGEVETVTIDGGLTLTAEGFTARADQATLDRRTGEMRLMGHPQLDRGADHLEGERILFWPETGRVVVEKARGRVQLPRLRPPGAPTAPASGPASKAAPRGP
jgi:lipopolysaccharide transport protein LptA